MKDFIYRTATEYKPLISVVIPTYNQIEYLKKSIKSVIYQSYKNWEILVIDNESTDGTYEFLKSIESNSIKIFSIKNNGVIATSRNLGIKYSIGDLVAFLDSDDIWYENKLQKIVKYFEHHENLDIVCANEIMVFEKNGRKKLIKYRFYDKDPYKSLINYGNSLSPSAVVIKGNRLRSEENYFSEDPRYITAEDYELWLRLAHKKYKFGFMKDVLGEYLIHESNNSRQKEIHNNSSLNALRDHVFIHQKFYKDQLKLWQKIESSFLLVRAKDNLFKGYVYKGLILIVKSFHKSPVNVMSQLIFIFRKKLSF